MLSSQRHSKSANPQQPYRLFHSSCGFQNGSWFRCLQWQCLSWRIVPLPFHKCRNTARFVLSRYTLYFLCFRVYHRHSCPFRHIAFVCESRRYILHADTFLWALEYPALQLCHLSQGQDALSRRQKSDSPSSNQTSFSAVPEDSPQSACTLCLSVPAEHPMMGWKIPAR